MFEWLALLATALLVGVAIKLMDDGLDAELDQASGCPNWAVMLGRAALPYALAALCIGVAIRPGAGVALFFSAYALGMGAGWRERLPSGVPAWVEIAIALALPVALSDWRTALSAVLIMGGAQLADDAIDLPVEPLAGGRVWAAWLGVPGLWLAAAACALWAAVVDWRLASASTVAAALLQGASRWVRWPC